jgi:hypothetical protein
MRQNSYAMRIFRNLVQIRTPKYSLSCVCVHPAFLTKLFACLLPATTLYTEHFLFNHWAHLLALGMSAYKIGVLLSSLSLYSATSLLHVQAIQNSLKDKQKTDSLFRDKEERPLKISVLKINQSRRQHFK